MDRTSDLDLQLHDYRLTTAEILYRLPDHPKILQSFVWQDYDLAPQYPVLSKFLDFWVEKIDGSLHSVYVARRKLIHPGTYHAQDGGFLIH